MRTLVWLAIAVWTVGQTPLRAETDQHIQVTGEGQAQAHFSVAEISVAVSGKAELAGDAITKYRDAKRRALEALKALGIENLTTREEGVAITQGGDQSQQMQRAMMGQGAAMPKPEVEVTEKLTLILTGIDKLSAEERIDALAEIIDASQDAGLVLGSSSIQQMWRVQMGQQGGGGLITFVLPDADALLKEAAQAAIEDARTRATHLAEMAGVTLGSVVSLTEGVTMGEDAEGMGWPWSFYMGMQQQEKDEGKRRLTSSTDAATPVTVAVSMKFAIQN